MIRIGIFGTDNSHSIGFSQFFNVERGARRIHGAKVVAIYGLDETRNREVAQKGNVPVIVSRPEEMLGLIDAAIVDFRHGSRHWKYARLCIEAGLPTFIDKPLAASVADAEKIVALARKRRVPVTSFSTLRFGRATEQFKRDVARIGKVRAAVITQPGSARDPYDGIFFYAVHGVELMLEVFGNNVVAARGVDHDGTLVASIRYRNGLVVTLHEIAAGWCPLTATAFGEKGVAHRAQDGRDDGFFVGAQKFTRMFRTGEMPLPLRDLPLSVRVLAAIEKSMRRGGAETRV
jgi:predicted dehydrogenase